MNYIICTTGRARSSILMGYLKQLGAGFPDEWLNPWFNSQRDFFDLDALCQFIQKRNVDGFCGMRTTFTGVTTACRVHKITLKQLVDKALPDAKYIYFTRDNLRQITESLYYENIQRFDDVPKVIPSKDIEAALVEYAISESCWEIYFQKYNITPLRITYEDLADARDMTLLKVLSFLGLDYPEGIQLVEKGGMRVKDGLTNNEEVDVWYTATMRRYLNLLGVK